MTAERKYGKSNIVENFWLCSTVMQGQKSHVLQSINQQSHSMNFVSKAKLNNIFFQTV